MTIGLELRHLRLSHAGRRLVDIDLTIEPGEIVTLMGPSGSGKSSLLQHICGMLPEGFQAQGEVWLNGRCLDQLPAEARGIGLLFQDDLLFPFLSVAGNLAFGLPQFGGRRARQAVIEQALVHAGLAGFGPRDPASLSGGERARVALLRALLAEPKALLLDEPFSKLDVALRENFREFVFSQVRARRLPVLMVSHDIADGLANGGRIIHIGASADG